MARLILALIMGLALLTWAASGVVQTTAREWFERDVNSRAQLVLVGASQSLANAWYGPRADLQKQLADLVSRDERVIGAAACDADLKPKASTTGFPEEFRCSAVGGRVRAAAANAGQASANSGKLVSSVPAASASSISTRLSSAARSHLRT